MNNYQSIQQESLNKTSKSVADALATITTGSSIDLYSYVSELAAALKQAINYAKTNFSYRPEESGCIPSTTSFNRNFKNIYSDLSILYEDLQSLRETALTNFNDLTTIKTQLESKIQTLYDKLANYKLYSLHAFSDVIYLMDSFTSVSKINLQITEDIKNVFINTTEGIATLPKQNTIDENITIDTITIDSSSNGVSGNNREIGQPRNGDISALLDNTPDTWWEFENSASTTFDPPLYLSLTLKLKTKRVVNNITITPMNFGTKKWVKIEDIATSVDNKEFLSVQDNDEYLLATNKASSTGSYTFIPRKAQYIKIVLTQDTPYSINTHFGNQSRWAIGIRDILVKGIKYESAGVLYSKEYTLDSEIKKIAVVTDEVSINDQFGEISHELSFDSGDSWTPILSIDEIPTGDTEEIITLETPSNTVIYKASFTRNDDAFSSDDSNEVIKNNSVLVSTPKTPPYTFKLNEKAVDGTIQIVDPNYGSVGTIGSPIKFRINSAVNPEYTLKIPGDLYKGTSRVFVGAKEYTEVNSFNGITENDYFYILDVSNKKIKFSSDYNCPSMTTDIYLWFKPERLYIESDTDFRFKTNFPTSGILDDMLVYSKGQLVSVSSVELGRYATKHKLPNKYLIAGTVEVESDPGDILGDEVSFVDGTEELYQSDSGENDFSVDVINGILYSKKITPTNYTGKISYYFNSVDSISKEGLIPYDADTEHRTFFIDSDYQKSLALVNTLSDGDSMWSGYSDNIYSGQVWPLYNIIEEDESTINGESGNITFNKACCLIPKSLYIYNSETGAAISGLVGEIPFEDGYTEFTKITDPTGLYSVDYKNAVVYFYDAQIGKEKSGEAWVVMPTGEWKIECRYTRYFAEYRLAYPITDFTLQSDNQTILLGESTALNSSLFGGVLRVCYDYTDSANSDLVDLAEYFSPILRSYALQIITEF